jgi:hypothetical protein
MKRYQVWSDPQRTHADLYEVTLETNDIDEAYTEAWEQCYAGRQVRIFDTATEDYLPF